MVSSLESITELAEDFVDELVLDRDNKDDQRSLSVFKDGLIDFKAYKNESLIKSNRSGKASIASNKNKGSMSFKKQGTKGSFSNRRERKNYN